jgi:iron complex transport system permease protein
MLLGEEQAAHLGIHIERLKLTAIILGSFLTALAVTLAGIVAFVGLVVPHTARLIYGPGHRRLIPTAACGGATFVIVADLLARVVLAPAILPLGAVTAVAGAPFFLHLLRRSKRDYAL